MSQGNGVLSSIFGGGSAAKPAPIKEKKQDLSAKVEISDLSPEAICTTDKFILVEGVLLGAVTITPQIADEWLKRNVDNIRRPMVPSIGEYAEAMKKNQWDFNGDPIRFDKAGNLIDGQNRLISCVESGKSFTTSVVYGIESVINIDIGRKRTTAQLLENAGFAESPQVGAVVNYLHNFRAKGGTSFSQVGHGQCVLTKQDAVDFAKEHATDIIHSINETKRTKQLFGKWSTHATLHYLFAETAGRPLADEFYEKLITGVGLTATSPILHLKDKLNKEKGNKNSKMTNNAYAGMVVKTWNAWISGKELTKLAYNYEKEKIAKIKRSPMSR